MTDERQANLRVTPAHAARRRSAQWRGIGAELIQVTTSESFEYAFAAPLHLFVACERAVRRDGETRVGSMVSARRDMGQTMSFVPAGNEFRGSFVPAVLPRKTYFYIDPATPLADPELRFAEIDFQPRLFFTDAALWSTAGKLAGLVENPDSATQLYAETLAAVLTVELARAHRGAEAPPPPSRGGLAGWQQKAVCDYIEDNLGEDVSLRQLAGLVRLSPSHLCRAFNRSLGMPPHRYQTHRRVERAKLMLADSRRAITEVAMACGFSASSNFATCFRRLTGQTPRDYRRSLA